MKIQKAVLFLLLFQAISFNSFSQLGDIKELPKNLFSGKVRLLVTYTMGRFPSDISHDDLLYIKLAEKFKEANKSIGLNVVQYGDNANVFVSRSREAYNKILSLNRDTITVVLTCTFDMLQHRESYIMSVYYVQQQTITAYWNVIHFTGGTFEKLIKSFTKKIKDYHNGYFDSAPDYIAASKDVPIELEYFKNNKDYKRANPKRMELIKIDVTTKVKGHPAQQEKNRKYDFTFGGETPKPIGYFGGNLRPYFKGIPSAEMHLKKYSNARTEVIFCHLGGIACIGVYAHQYFNHDEYFNGVQIGSITAFLGLMVADIFADISREGNIVKAVEEYNKHVTGTSSMNKQNVFVPDHYGIAPVYHKSSGTTVCLNANWKF